jgi:hypothetical protein
MAIFNANFLNNPETFAKNYAISVIDRNLAVVPPDPLKGPNMRGQGYLKVAKADRVSYCQISDSGGTSSTAVTGATGGRAAIITDALPVGPDVANWFAVYYLPWAGNQTFRITLKPGAVGGADPDIFFTSALNGCSVFVEGTAQVPTVYHLNDAASAGGEAPIGSDLPTNTAFWNPLKNNMEARFQGATSPKAVLHTPGGQAVQGAKVVHALDYMDVTQHYYQGLMLGSIQKLNKEELLATTQKPGELVSDVAYRGNIYQPYGTVFGWKQHNAWRFFFQKRGFIAYQYQKTYDAKSKYKPGQSDTFYVKRHVRYDCQEFWPNGGGQAVAKANRALV